MDERSLHWFRYESPEPPQLVEIERILFKKNVPAGMNPLSIMHFAYLYRSSNEDMDPIELIKMRDGYYRLDDGRHRTIGSLIAGRTLILSIFIGAELPPSSVPR
jgi:hypothetical protein